MYLKLTERLSPKKVASALLPDLRPDQVECDFENVYEWAYVDLPELAFSLNVSRNHGMSDIDTDDDVLDGLTSDAIEALSISGPTYIFGWNRRTESYVHDLSDHLIQRISDSIQSEILIYPGRINADADDPEPIGQVNPRN